MRYFNSVENILGQRSKIRILRYLTSIDKDASIREISKKIKIAPPNTSIAMKELAREGVLTSKRIGRSIVYSLNTGHHLVEKLIKPMFKAEQNILPDLLEMVKTELPFSYESIILFGSVSRRQEKAHSDIDIAVIVKDNIDIKKAETAIDNISLRVIKLFGNALSLMIMHKSDFIRNYKKGQPLAREIAGKGEVVFGKLINELL
jgi:predicted nucleotidyltransferase